MKITIEAETPEELKHLSEPWVRAGVQRVGLAGRSDPKTTDGDFEFGFIHGPWQQVKVEVSRLIIDGDAITNQKNAVDAVLQARGVMVHQAQVDQATRNVLAARNGKIIH